MHLNKSQALSYARHRHMDSDAWRNKRQQQVLKAVAKKILTPSNIVNLPNILDSLSGSIKTTIKISELLEFSKQHSEFLSDLDNSLILHSNSIKYIDDKESDIYYALFDNQDFKRTQKMIKTNLELDKSSSEVPRKLPSFDFDYYKSKSS